MTGDWKEQLVGGFADPAPTPVASGRHLRRLLLIAGGIAVAMLLQARRTSPAPVTSRIPLYLALMGVELVLAWFVTIGIRARGFKLSDLVGARRRSALEGSLQIITAAATVALLRSSGPILHRLLGRWASQTGFLLPTTPAESAVWIFVSIAAGICEELVFRGYLQRQFWGLTRSLSLALLLQSLIFGFGHIYQGWKPALVTAIYGLVFGLVAAWRRSIIPGAIAHAVVDILGGLKL